MRSDLTLATPWLGQQGQGPTRGLCVLIRKQAPGTVRALRLWEEWHCARLAEVPGTNRKQMKITRQEAGLSAAAWRRKTELPSQGPPSCSSRTNPAPCPEPLSSQTSAHLLPA